MKRTESDPTEEFSFDAKSSNVEVTRGERLRNFYEEYIYKPGLIAWDDRRTRYGGLLLSIYILMGTVGVWFYEKPAFGNDQQYVPPFEKLSAPLGSNDNGVDVLAQIIHATPDMLLLVVSGAVFATFMGVVIGTVAGYKGGTTDRIITSLSDTAMTIPGLPVVVVLAYGLQIADPILVGPIIMINYWAGLARTLRSEVLKLRESSYVEASRAMGVSTPKILFKDVIPNMMPYILVNFAFAARYVVFASVGLFYIGVLPPTMNNWGLQLDKAVASPVNGLAVGKNNYLVFFPLLAIMFLALSLVLLAQGLDRLFNPRVRTRLAGESESTTMEEDEDNVVAGGM